MLHIVTSLGVSLSVPDVAVASGFRELVGDSVVDGQMQRHRAVATVNSLEVLHVVAALGVGLAIPGVAVASRFGELVSDGAVDG